MKRRIKPDKILARQTESCLRREYDAVFPERRAGKPGPVCAPEPIRAALCLSGGGIRSATFCLGVLQALTRANLLTKFHYLSTVSGGGYIGAWLTASIHHRGTDAVLQELATPTVDMPPSFQHLRDYSNYLTPRLGLTSGDTLAAIAGVVRNLLLTWLVLVPLLWIAALAPKLVGALAHVSRLPGSGPWQGPAAVAAIAVAVLLTIVSLAFTMQFARRVIPGQTPAAFQARFLYTDLFLAVIAGAGFASMLDAVDALRWNAAEALRSPPPPPPWLAAAFDLTCLTRNWWPLPLAAACVHLVAWLLRRMVRGKVRRVTIIVPRDTSRCGLLRRALRKRMQRFADGLAWLIGGAATGAILWAGAMLYEWEAPDESVLVIFGMPWFLLALLGGQITLQLLRSYSRDGDFQREWLARAGGYYLAAAALWIVVSALVLLGPDWADDLIGDYDSGSLVGLSGLGAISGLATALLGKSGATPARGAAQGWVAWALDIGLSVAGPLFAAILLILLSIASDALVFHERFVRSTLFEIGPSDNMKTYPVAWAALIAAFLIPGLSGYVANLLVNVNRFSLHAIYRNRLIRAYLGAARLSRGKNPRIVEPFTEFDQADNIRMQDIWKADGKWRPFHVINMTLNISAGEKLAWQQRKAASFTATPLHCGSKEIGYRPTAAYGDPARGISLGTAVAISGAAFSSNMGYHSSPSVSFLLTLLNVRLGWWLGNTGRAGNPRYWFKRGAWYRHFRRAGWISERWRVVFEPYRKDGPWLAFRPYIAELFGLLTDRSPYIYLTDGGHFENLGIYEMVRRQCRQIVAIDADADGDYEFEDLGNAVRKVRIDFGVELRFPALDRFYGSHIDPARRPTFLIGEIIYPGDAAAKQPPGTILYIKPAVHGRPADVAAYGRTNAAFPFDTTFNQWFSEPQFESYRALGAETVEMLCRQASNPADLAGLMTELARRPSPDDWS